MKKFLRNNGIWVLICALVLTGAISLAAVFAPNLFAPVTHGLGVLATPFRAAASFCTDGVKHWSERLTGYDEMKVQVEELEQQVASLKEENRDAQAALEENRRLRDLLNLQQAHRDFTFISAHITARTSSSWNSTLTLSKGVSDGLEKDMCVVTEQGYLVGVITDAASNWATVATIIDPETSIGARISRTGDAGILTGDLDEMTRSRARLTYLSSDAALRKGDTVVTSGLGGVYPPELVVGEIIEEGMTPSGMERYALVEPGAALEDLQQVFVVTQFDVVE